MTFAARVAHARAGLIRNGWVPCANTKCSNYVALKDGERGPVYCDPCGRKMKATKQRGVA